MLRFCVGNVALYFNNCTGTLAFPYRLAAVAGAHRPIYRDFTGDGIADIAVLSSRAPLGFDSGVALLRGVDGLRPLSAVSRKAHGSAGPNSNSHQVILTFAAPVTFASASLASGNGAVESASASGAVVTLNLTNVANAQTLSIMLSNASNGTQTRNVAIPISFLVGDTNGNGSVNATDVSQAKAQSGQGVTSANFRSDVNSNGTINATDPGQVKSAAGTGLP